MFFFKLLSAFKLTIWNQTDTILVEGLLKKKFLRENSRLGNSKTRNHENFYQSCNLFQGFRKAHIIWLSLSCYFSQLLETRRKMVFMESFMINIFFYVPLCLNIELINPFKIKFYFGSTIKTKSHVSEKLG